MGKVKAFKSSSRHKKGWRQENLAPDSNDGNNISETFQSQTWQEARRKLRSVVDQNLTELPVKTRKCTKRTAVGRAPAERHNANFQSKCWACYQQMVEWDLVLALVASILLLMVSIFSYKDRKNNIEPAGTAEESSTSTFLSPQAATYVYITQIIGSALAILSSCTSLMVVWARRRASQKNRNVGVRRALRFFSAFLKRCEDVGEVGGASSSGGGGGSGSGGGSKRPCMKHQRSSNSSIHPHAVSLTKAGTTLTDIYSVYRSGEWVQVPSLLLVEGDVIALQVGDFAPALVEEILNTTKRKSVPDNSDLNPIQVHLGERITVDTCSASGTGSSHGDTMPSLPRGKLTLSADSVKLLSLCNDMRLFRMKETPLSRFLQFDYGELVFLLPLPDYCNIVLSKYLNIIFPRHISMLTHVYS
jgi:hypothetical protein